ncbi:Spy/CpxP family protein refolding chaperone [Aliamphritea ceti]|uniref:Spy/CpxP family protein refolding chaperone n=1 Tax=Aliamphritea ceti TaxID=1524258 RepID=UPI0021C36DA0|nr:Spy/CpxP family protein refolding chaperone [Aliamphritea ceti]
MRKSIIIAITTATVGLTTLGIGAAQAGNSEGYGCGKGEYSERGEHGKGRHGKFGMQGMSLERLDKKLELTDAQEDTLAPLFDQQFVNMRQQMREMKSLRQDLKNLNVADTDYSQQVETLIKQGQDAAATLIRSKAELKQKVYAELTPEQQEKFTSLAKK